MIDNYDILIVGAGPAGLSVASELSQKYKVLVIDKKERAGYYHRSWFCPDIYVNDKPELQPFLYPGIHRFILRTFEDKDDLTPPNIFIHPAQMKYWYIAGEQMLEFFDQKIRSAPTQSQTSYNSTYLSHQISQEGVELCYEQIENGQSKQHTVRAKLLVNAAGYGSPISAEYQTYSPDIMWWSVYCPEVRHPKNIADIHKDMQPRDYLLWAQFSDPQLSDEAATDEGRLIFEYEMLSQNPFEADTAPHSTPMIFYLTDDRKEKEMMKNKYEWLLKNNDYVKSYFGSAELVKENWGWYPSGGIDQMVARNRCAFIGDSAVWTTACGWGASFILRYYKKYAGKLDVLLQENRLDEESLKSINDFNEAYDFQLLMDQLMIRFLVAADPKSMNGFIKTFNDVPFLLCEKLFTLTLEPNEFGPLLKAMMKNIGLITIMKVLRPRDYDLFIKVSLDFIEEFTKEEIKDLLHFIQDEMGDASNLLKDLPGILLKLAKKLL
jgi:NAD(P)-binding Rossmann-like domain